MANKKTLEIRIEKRNFLFQFLNWLEYEQMVSKFENNPETHFWLPIIIEIKVCCEPVEQIFDCQ